MKWKDELNQLKNLVDSFKKIHIESESVNNWQNPFKLLDTINLSLGDSHSELELQTVLNKYIDYSVKTGHHQYLNQLFSGYNNPAVIGEILASLMNTSMYTYEVAPVATLMELEVIKKMNSYTGYDNGGGIFTTGGSNSNLLSILVARNKHFPELKQKGLNQSKPLCIFTSADAHYSFDKAAFITGIGTDNVITIPYDDEGAMDINALESAITKSRNDGKIPFYVCATAGTTELGAFDDINAISQIAKKENLWFHVDGSWGGPLIMSQKTNHLFKGIDQADSFAWNPHKLMNVPLVCAALLFKDEQDLAEATASQNTDYIFHEHEDKYYDLGTKSLQCGRKNDALKIWAAWHFYGDEGYQKRINNSLDLAQYATSIVDKNPSLELLAPTKTLNVNFRYLPKYQTDINAFNLKVRDALYKSGKTLVNYCHLNGIVSIRLVLVNGELQKSDIDTFFKHFIEAAQNLEIHTTLD